LSNPGSRLAADFPTALDTRRGEIQWSEIE
jgi:hypothetical protein